MQASRAPGYPALPGSYLWAALPAATSVVVGTQALVSDIAPMWVPVYSDGTYWRVRAAIDIVFDTTSANGDLTGNDQVIKSATLPIGLLRAGRSFGVKALYGKSGTTDAATGMKLRIGTTGTTADASIFTTGSFSAASRSFATETQFFLNSATQIRVLGAQSVLSAWSGVATTSAWSQSTTIPNVDSNALIVSAGLDMAGTTDTPQVHHMVVTLYP